jgi:hypothetical protein
MPADYGRSLPTPQYSKGIRPRACRAPKTKKPPLDFSGGGSCYVVAIAGETNS